MLFQPCFDAGRNTWMTGGMLRDRLGARNVYVVGLATFTLASALCGFAPGLTMLTMARGLRGIGSAMLVPCRHEHRLLSGLSGRHDGGACHGGGALADCGSCLIGDPKRGQASSQVAIRQGIGRTTSTWNTAVRVRNCA